MHDHAYPHTCLLCGNIFWSPMLFSMAFSQHVELCDEGMWWRDIRDIMY